MKSCCCQNRFSTARKYHYGFGNEHVPLMLVEKDWLVYFGTNKGVVYCIDPIKQKVCRAFKIDNYMLNTIRIDNGGKVIVATMDGN